MDLENFRLFHEVHADREIRNLGQKFVSHMLVLREDPYKFGDIKMPIRKDLVQAF